MWTSENRINLISAWPGEKYQVRIIGRPSIRYRFYFQDGNFLDLVSPDDIKEITGKYNVEYWMAVKYNDSLFCMEIPNDLFSILSSCSAAISSSLGGYDGREVFIEVHDGIPRFTASVGEYVEVDDDVFENISDIKEMMADEILLPSNPQTISSMDYNIDHPTVDHPDIFELDDESEHDLLSTLYSFALQVSESGCDYTAMMAADMIQKIKERQK